MSSFFLLLALSGFLFNNLTEYNWEYPLFQVLFYFLSSIIFVMKRFQNPEREEISFHGTRFCKIAISGFLIIFWGFFVGSPWLANYYLSKAKKLQPENGEKAIHDLLKASFLDSSNPEPYSSLSHIYRGAWFNTKNALFFERAVQYQQKVIRSFPMEADFYLDAAKLYENGKRIDEAQLYYEKAIDINPNTPHYKQELALFLARNNKTERAIALWKDLRVFLERYEPKGIFLMTVYMNLCASYDKMQDNESLGYYLNLVMNFPDDMIREEPADSPITKTFISYKKRAKEELTNLVRRKKL
jgi:tetratricopeptide (TPR) repeat protein